MMKWFLDNRPEDCMNSEPAMDVAAEFGNLELM